MTPPKPPAPPDDSILSQLNPSFIASLTPEAYKYLSNTPFKIGNKNFYDPFSGRITLTSPVNRGTVEEEALHALTLGMGTKGGGLGRFTKRVFYPGSHFGFSDEEKETARTDYGASQFEWLYKRGVESGPSSWNYGQGDFAGLPVSAQEELGQFFTTPPPPHLQNDPDYTAATLQEKVEESGPTIESTTPFLPTASWTKPPKRTTKGRGRRTTRKKKRSRFPFLKKPKGMGGPSEF